ncbi:MAG: hypothetical protein V1739_05080 [Candidatus Omnitrophota bacterium]
MKLIIKQIQFMILIVILSLFTFGCASPYLLRKQKPTLKLQPNEGVVLFSCKFLNKDNLDKKNIFTVTGLTLQEVNQYKAYGEKKFFLIPSLGENYIKQDDLFLFSLKLPRGTYKMTSLNGLLRSFFSTQYFVAANKLFDVIPGRISYAGRVGIGFFVSGGLQIYETQIDDKFEEDQGRFNNGYPALQNRTIVKDLIY